MAERDKGMHPDRDNADEDQPFVPRNALDRVRQPILAAAMYVPRSSEPKASDPETRAKELTSRAALGAAALSGTLAAPFGPYGLITLIPDILGIWRIQSQLVADIAAAYGKGHSLTTEEMLKCLFKMASAQVLRDVVVRVGERTLIRRPSVRAMQHVAMKFGFRVTQRLIGRAITRALPMIGTIGAAAYAYRDTRQVGAIAMELFGNTSTAVPS
jgi:hypothetical protein